MSAENPLRSLPKIDRLLGDPRVLSRAEGLDRDQVKVAVQLVIDRIRMELLAGGASVEDPDLLERIHQELDRRLKPSLRRVVNASGVVIHTGLGRSALAPAAVRAVQETAGGYCNLELDLDSGERGLRHDHVERLLCELTGAEAALMVNNNAGAVLLCLSALARGGEVVVSRGELVEIGGGFRIPDVMAQSGAVLREVGATNKTYLRDYRQAIGSETALLFKAHTSNFRIVGFHHETRLEELAALGREREIPVVMDLGSGTLIPVEGEEIREPSVQEVLASGVDLVTFSGDKLLGGPQAGVIVGRRELVHRVGSHPLTRALRPCKLSFAAMEATLRLYLDRDQALREIPTLAMLHRTEEQLGQAARRLRGKIRRKLGEGLAVRITDEAGRVGGGALPMEALSSRVLVLEAPGITAEELARRLRNNDPAVLCRVQQDRLIMDPRTLLPGEEELVIRGLEQALA